MSENRLADDLGPPRIPSGLDPQTAEAARAFLRRLDGRYSYSAGIVFGSRARGTQRADSNADLAVILKGERGNRWMAARDMAGIAFDVMLETDVLIDPLPLWESELKKPGFLFESEPHREHHSRGLAALKRRRDADV